MPNMKTYNTDPGIKIIEWNLGGTESGDPVRVPAFTDKSYGMWGTWGSATCVLQGSWDIKHPPEEGSWMALKESDNSTAASQTANGCGVVLENPVWIRPKTTGGTGSVIQIVLTAKTGR
jgi:hypothetical protein